MNKTESESPLRSIIKKISAYIPQVEKPKKKITSGHIFIRHPGSFVVETYKFSKDRTEIKMEFIDYDENRLTNYTDVLKKYKKESTDVFIVVETSKYIETKQSLLPVLKHVLKNKVVSMESEPNVWLL